jgi:hypothetical protein
MLLCPKASSILASFQLPLETSNLSDVAFGKATPHNLLGGDIEKNIQNYGKNFPVDKTWVPAFPGMTAVWRKLWDTKTWALPYSICCFFIPFNPELRLSAFSLKILDV